MKAERKRRQPKQRNRKPTPSQITHDNESFRHACEFLKQRICLSAIKMMENLRTRHDIDAPCGKREQTRIAAEHIVRGRTSCSGERCRELKPNGDHTRAMSFRVRTHCARDITEPGSNVEQHEYRTGRGLLNQRRQGSQHGALSAEQPIAARDVAKRTGRKRRVHAGIVE